MRIVLTLFLASLVYLPVNVHAACSGSSCCTVSAGVTTAPIEDTCEIEPASYGITLYEKYLCTGLPTVPAAGSAYALDVGTKCFQTFDSASGSTVDMSSSSTGVSFDGTFTRPPNGVYTFGVMIIKNEFRIKADLELTTSITGDDGGTGKYCVSTANTGDEDDGNSLSCSASDGATPGTFTSKLTTFSGACGESFTGSASFTFTSTDVISAWLLDSDNELAESCTESATKATLFGLQTFATPVIITELTSGFNMAFGVSSGSSFWQNGSGGDYSIGSGPFKAIITPLNY